MMSQVVSTELLNRMDAYWRAAKYLSIGQIFLYDNPLPRHPLALDGVKNMLLGHWGTTPGQNFIYAHLNRIVKQYHFYMMDLIDRLPQSGEAGLLLKLQRQQRPFEHHRHIEKHGQDLPEIWSRSWRNVAEVSVKSVPSR